MSGRGRRGSVWFESARAGTLVESAGGRLRFAYDPSWLQNGTAISLSLPLSRTELDAHEFFAGLLPEGIARQRICRQYRLRDDDDIGLLLAIGRDCAGALAVVPEDEALPSDAVPVPITDDDLARLVESRGQALPGPAENRRFSLAGAQDKLAVRIDAEGLWLPSWHRPSTHILKFETSRWICFAEWAANDLARRLGLPVPEIGYERHPSDPSAPYLRVVRYDRRPAISGAPMRLHQEDMTQAMGVSSVLKYEEHGGPSLGTIATIIRRHAADPIANIRTLRDWQIFNYLAGNSDGHAKNLALLYDNENGIPRLAPLYDLVCIEFLNHLGMHYDRKLAFFIGKNNVPEQVTREDWTALAKAIGVPAKSLLERLRELATALPHHARETRASFADRFGDNQALEKLEASIRDRCGWALRSVIGKG
jgi:serine/threonine-protein kinase HipA